MRRSPRLRAQACLLLLSLVGGGIGLPLADALVFHRATPTVQRGRSLGDEGAPAKSHTQLCVIAKAVQTKMGVPVARPTLSPHVSDTGASPHSVTSLPRSDPRHSPALPRAPPPSRA